MAHSCTLSSDTHTTAAFTHTPQPCSHTHHSHGHTHRNRGHTHTHTGSLLHVTTHACVSTPESTLTHTLSDLLQLALLCPRPSSSPLDMKDTGTSLSLSLFLSSLLSPPHPFPPLCFPSFFLHKRSNRVSVSQSSSNHLADV